MSHSRLYIQASVSPEDRSGVQWVSSFLWRCSNYFVGWCDVIALDECHLPESSGTAAFVLQVLGERTGQGFDQVHAKFLADRPQRVKAQVIGLPLEFEMNVDLSDVQVAYFRKPQPRFSLVYQTDANVELLHRPTGLTARCQYDRSRRRNFDLALGYLRAQLYAKQGGAAVRVWE
jgi:hypothetical protein